MTSAGRVGDVWSVSATGMNSRAQRACNEHRAFTDRRHSPIRGYERDCVAPPGGGPNLPLLGVPHSANVADSAGMRRSSVSSRCLRLRELLANERGMALVMALGIMLVLTIALTTVITLTAAGARDANRSNAWQKA